MSAAAPTGSEQSAHSGASFGYVQTETGETALIYPRDRYGSSTAEPRAGRQESSGIIFTDRQDMPSLEQLLRENRLAYAVLEAPPQPPAWSAYVRIATGSAAATAVSTVGVLLFWN